VIADFESLSHQSYPYLNGGQPIVAAVSKSDGRGTPDGPGHEVESSGMAECYFLPLEPPDERAPDRQGWAQF
jgi:hypothetical protein